ncbi:MAG TPA: IlvD/Edd family dehydratase [Roseiflexaceae bacterium]|nr:IlvD/Edd family dehydratase [Roseiflexaceae bacterium]
MMKPRGLANNLTEYGDSEFALYLRRSFAKAMGFSDEALARPVIGILNTYSELNNCHRHFPQLVEAVKRGVWQAGGLPLEFPTISLGEVFLSPTSMLYRNLMSLDVETMLRAQPLDAVVLTGGCDKTMPALLMGAASAGVPAIAVVAGPMLANQYEGERIGACTDCRRYWAKYRRGEIDRAQIDTIEGQLAPTPGTCGVMGTASTMACLTEALGMTLLGGASIPAVYADRMRHAEQAGKQACRLAETRLTPEHILTPEAFDNALRVLQAIGGSTNAVIHLTAIAGRLGIKLDLERLNELAETTPVLLDLKPTGEGYMEDFHRSGGMPVVMQELKHLLHLDARTVTGRTWREILDAPCTFPTWQTFIRPAAEPLQSQGALIMLRGNLAPDGAVLKRSAASPDLINRTGRAVVFSSLDDLAARIDSPDLDVTPDDFLVLQNAGPLGAPGMPEAGYLPIPKKLTGVKDMVRISDARMSGTAFGTIILHVTPEAAVGGPLGLVRNGDRIELSADRRELNLLVDAQELERRRAEAQPHVKPATRGYEYLYQQHCQQANLGADFDFLRHPSLREAEEQ